MPITKKLAIVILKYLDSHPDFEFPFAVMCKQPDDNYLEVTPDHRDDTRDDQMCKRFQLRSGLADELEHPLTLRLMAK